MLNQTENKPKRKGDLQKLLNGFSVHVVRSEIISVIKEERNCSEKEAKDIKTLYPKEVTEVLRRFQ